MNPNAPQPLSLTSFIKSLIFNWNLIIQITKRDVVGRYRGSFIGIGWSFLNPLLMLCVFTFVFSVVFNAKWGVAMEGQDEGKGFFAIVLFVGLIIHGFFSEIITRSPSVIISNVNYVKKVIFPLEILPVTALFSALFHMAISLTVWFFVYVIFVGLPSWHVIYFPVVIAPLVILAFSVSYFLASLGVFLRDIGQTMGLVSTVLLFLSPIFFPVERLPEAYQTFFMLNPLTFIIQEARGVLIWQQTPNFFGIFVYLITAIVLFLLGYAWFQKTRRGFSDVL